MKRTLEKSARRRVLGAMAATPVAMITGLQAPAAVAQSKAGADLKFQTINPPQPVDTQGKIEVIEFFWYGCPHCYALEPFIENWSAKLAPDVEFRRIPAPLSQAWVPHAQAYYAFETLGVLAKVHRVFFDAIHKERLRVDDRKAFEQWLQKNGIDPKKFEEAARSFGVENNVRRAGRMAAAYRLTGVPAFAIQGRYVVGAEDVPSQEGLMAAVDQLTARVRAELKPASAAASREPAKKSSPAKAEKK